MHDHGHAPFDAVDDLLGDFLALVDFHHHALAVGAQGKKSMHTGIQVKVDDRVGRFVIDGAVILESHRHRHQYSFNLLLLAINAPFAMLQAIYVIANP